MAAEFFGHVVLILACVTSAAATCNDSYSYRYIPIYQDFRHERRFNRFYPSCGFRGCYQYRVVKTIEALTITCSSVSPDVFLNYTYATARYPQDLVIKDSSIPVIPSNSSLSNFGGINKLKLKNLSIEDISSGAFKNLQEIKILDLSWNKLVKIPDEVFQSLSKLKQLDLSGNKLEVISGDFQNFQFLEYVDMSNNPLIEVRNVSFKNLKKFIARNTKLKQFDIDLSNLLLDSVDLSNGFLESINFDKLPNVAILELQNNHINEVKYWNNINSRKVSLNNNSITLLDNIPENIQDLDLSHNKIATIGANNTESKTQLLNLSFNNISELNIFVFSNLKNLKKLNLDSNSLEILLESTFANCTSLEEVDISSNKLKDIESGVFGGVSSLTTLDLSHNSLKSLNYFMLPAENKVAKLYINNNEISNVDVELFQESFPKISEIKMNNNSWFCEDLDDILYNFGLRFIEVKDKDALDSVGNEDAVGGIYCKYNRKS